MMKRALVPGMMALAAAASPLLAHHAWPVDTSRAVTLSGTVTGYEWGNPQVKIVMVGGKEMFLYGRR